jgi:hypothetical protein
MSRQQVERCGSSADASLDKEEHGNKETSTSSSLLDYYFCDVYGFVFFFCSVV